MVCAFPAPVILKRGGRPASPSKRYWGRLQVIYTSTQAQWRWPSSHYSACLTGAHSQPRTAWSSCPRWPTQYLASAPGGGAPGPDPRDGQRRPGHHGQASARTGRHGQAQPAWASAAVRRWQPQGLKARLWISWRSPPALSVPGPEARASQLQPGRHGQAPAALAVRANIYKNHQRITPQALQHYWQHPAAPARIAAGSGAGRSRE